MAHRQEAQALRRQYKLIGPRGKKIVLPDTPEAQGVAFIAAVLEADPTAAAVNLKALMGRSRVRDDELALRFGKWALALADPPNDAGYVELESKLFEAAAEHSGHIEGHVPEIPRY